MKKTFIVIILLIIFIFNCCSSELSNNIKENNDKKSVCSFLIDKPLYNFSSYVKFNYPRVRLILAMNAGAFSALFLTSTAISSVLTYFYIKNKKEFDSYDSLDEDFKAKEDLVISYLISFCVMWSVSSVFLITSIILWTAFGVICYKIFTKNVQVFLNTHNTSVDFGLSYRL